MKLCIIGDGLVSLTLAKALVNNGIYVDVFSNQKLKKFDKTRTIGISKSNFDFINKKIINIKKLSWRIDEIKIFNRTINKEEILNFKDIKNHLFFMIKNFELIDYLIKELNSNKFFKLKKKHDINKILKLNYNLIINCENNNFITKKFFFKKIIKDYKSIAYATIIEHKKKKDNHTATQIFTERGPLAFLPLSEFETSIVYSARGLRNLNLKELIRKYNSKYSITKIHESSNLALKAINLRSYYHNNILAFGDLLHRLHPLAGQGFNMSIRDINILLDLIEFKLNLGLEIDKSICTDFEKKVRHKNYLFSNGIDLIYEFFLMESKFKNPILSKTLQFLGKNKNINNFFTKFADNGIVI